MTEKYTDESALLVAQTGPLNGQRWPLRKSILIGRESSCDIVVPDRQVSRHHARIDITRDGLILEDLDSKNGTHHNGQRMSAAILLQDGDVIQIAVAQKFIFLSSDATVPLTGEGIPDLESDKTGALEPGASIGHRRLRLDKRSRRVMITSMGGENEGKEVEILPPLSVSQFRLLEMLYEEDGRVVSRPDLIGAVWGERQVYEISEQALDALIRRLRERIASIDPAHEYIVTLRGHGLRLENPKI